MASSRDSIGLRAQLEGFAVALAFDREQHRRARLQQVRDAASVSEKITASNWPVGSENMAKANLLPFCDRRSRADTTTPARRPAAAPRSARASSSAKRDDAELGQHARIGVERMAGEEEADRLELVLQPLHGRPRPSAAVMSICGRVSPPAAEQIVDALCRVRRDAVGERQHLLDVAVHQRAVGLQLIEGAGCSQRLQRALVERLGVAAAGEIGQVLERALGGALGDDALDRLRADVLERRQRIADGLVAGEEVDLGGIDAGRQDGDAGFLGFRR